jgi:multiple sugar transport system substrate-binding protein
MKKGLAILLAGLLTVSLSACGSTKTSTNNSVKNSESGETNEKKVVTMWRHVGTPEEDTFYKGLIEEFNNTNKDIELKVTSFPDNSYSDQVDAALLSGELPDIFDIDGPQMAGFVNSGALALLDKYITDDLKNDLLPSLFEQGKYDDGKIYSLGQFESGLSFWANKAYLEKAGVRIPTLDNPWDEVEFMEALDKLQSLDEVKYALDLKINYGGGYWIYSYLPIIGSFGGDVLNRQNYTCDETLNGKGTIKAYKLLQDLINKGYVNATQSTDDDLYGSKISALSLVGHWMYGPHTKALGDDAILIPFPNFGNGVLTGSGSWAWSMSTAAEKHGVADEAWKVIDFLLSKDSIKGICNANGAVPGRSSALNELPDYQEGGRLYLYREQLEKNHALVRPVTPAFNVIQSVLGEASMNIINGADVKTELDKAAKEIDQTITDNGYHGK